jgi:deoxyadenosine/deoxycytidine kinase
MIFARKNLQSDEYLLYSRLFNIINSTLKKPELIIFLHNSIDQLMQNIRDRGRNYEQNIQPAYLEMIQTGYFEYFRQNTNLTVLIINTEGVDFVNNNIDYKRIKSIALKKHSPGIHRINSIYEIGDLR